MTSDDRTQIQTEIQAMKQRLKLPDMPIVNQERRNQYIQAGEREISLLQRMLENE